MWALTTIAYRLITIMTQYSESFWKTVLYQPKVQIASTYLISMLCAAASDMVYAQKFFNFLTATFTFRMAPYIM